MRFAFSVFFAMTAGMAGAACPGQTTVELNECATAELAQADAALNAAWGPAKAYMDGIGHGDQLLDAQRKWLAFRDSACAAEAAPYSGGSIQPLIWSGCLTRLTRARTQELLEFGRY